MIKENNFKKIITSTFIIVSFFGVAFTAKSLTIADIELLISVGLISPENAQRARDFVNPVSVGLGNAVKLDPNSNIECLVINQNLLRGQSGTLISALQRFLKQQGHFPATQEVTGIFGEVTVKAVSDFQLRQGLISSSQQIGAGTVGPLTRAKIQEVSCRSLGDTRQEVEVAFNQQVQAIQNYIKESQASTTPSVNRNFVQNEVDVSLTANETYENTETGELRIRYTIRVEPIFAARDIKIVMVCDPVFMKFNHLNFNECGKIFDASPIVSGRKSFVMFYRNTSRIPQPVVFAAEVFDEFGKSLGLVETTHVVKPAEPVIKLDLVDNSLSQSGMTPLFQGRICSREDQLEFIRYYMTPYNPANPVRLPVCWPGELLCNNTFPPTFCQITNGPNSDDLCISSQRFVDGRCVPRQ
jgi:peptidoglycan hydrolase-like protein with peptidoglycan-binding domain